jgi:hypothetical protein
MFPDFSFQGHSICMTPSFSLVKWYMDCVTEEGEAAIVYFADLKWRGVHAYIGSVLTAGKNDAPMTRTSLGRYELESSAELISIVHPKLKIKGRWERDAGPFRRTMYEEKGGSVIWDCIQTRSRVSVSIGNRELKGLGYAECLSVTVPPWQLPLRELRWGRFVAENHTLAWVDWRGSYSCSVAVLDSREAEMRSVSHERVVAGNAVLDIAPGVSLRAGRLGSTILPGASGLGKLFPRNLFSIEEEKNMGQGTLTLSEQESRGWVIHEVVKWEL